MAALDTQPLVVPASQRYATRTRHGYQRKRRSGRVVLLFLHSGDLLGRAECPARSPRSGTRPPFAATIRSAGKKQLTPGCERLENGVRPRAMGCRRSATGVRLGRARDASPQKRAYRLRARAIDSTTSTYVTRAHPSGGGVDPLVREHGFPATLHPWTTTVAPLARGRAPLRRSRHESRGRRAPPTRHRGVHSSFARIPRSRGVHPDPEAKHRLTHSRHPLRGHR